MIKIYKLNHSQYLSIYDELSNKDKLSLQDIHGRELMLIKRGWNKYVDEMRDDLIKNDPTIIIKEFEFFDISVFNECENNKSLLIFYFLHSPI